MKKILLFLMFISVLVSCKKTDEEPDIPSVLDGKWEWVRSTGGIGGYIETPASTGNKIRVEFDKGKYKKYINDTLKQETTYNIIKASSVITEGDVDVINYTDKNITNQSFEVYDNELTLFDECIDCYVHKYVKK